MVASGADVVFVRKQDSGTLTALQTVLFGSHHWSSHLLPHVPEHMHRQIQQLSWQTQPAYNSKAILIADTWSLDDAGCAVWSVI